MEFYGHPDVYSALVSPRERKKLSTEAFYKESFYSSLSENQPEQANRHKTEELWYSQGRPYYRVYPGIIRPFLRLKEDQIWVKELLPLPDVVDFQFPKNPDLMKDLSFVDNGKRYTLKSTLFASYDGGFSIETLTRVSDMSISFWMDWGEVSEIGYPIVNFYNFGMNQEGTIEEEIQREVKGSENCEGLRVPTDLQLNAIRVILGILLLSHNNEEGIIKEDVLNKDQEKFEKTNDPKYVEKAKRRGKNGFVVGKGLDVLPTRRGPSPLALYWTGPGKKIPKRRWRKGCWVHRDKVNKVPMGYGDSNG